MDLDPRALGETSKAACRLGTWSLGTERRRLGLVSRTLGVSVEIKVKSLGLRIESFNFLIHNL